MVIWDKIVQIKLSKAWFPLLNGSITIRQAGWLTPLVSNKQPVQADPHVRPAGQLPTSSPLSAIQLSDQTLFSCFSTCISCQIDFSWTQRRLKFHLTEWEQKCHPFLSNLVVFYRQMRRSRTQSWIVWNLRNDSRCQPSLPGFGRIPPRSSIIFNISPI